GEPRALDPNDPNVLNHAIPGPNVSNYGFIVRVDPTYANGMVVMDNGRQWNSDYGQAWFQRAMVGLGAMLGLQRANDLPVTNLMAFDSSEPYPGSLTDFFGNSPPEPVFPGNADILHGQYIHRPDSNDIDLYRFTIDLNDANLDEKRQGMLAVESFAERLPNSSQLDTVLSLYREIEIRDENGVVVGYERELISRNNDYFSSDSYISMELGSGTYYIGVTSAGNTDFDPVLEDTGYGGTSQGDYEIRVTFRSQVDENNVISDLDRSDEGRPGTRLDGDGDGVAGGVFDYWFPVRSLDRVIQVTDDGNTYHDGQTLTIENSAGVVRRFEFDRGDGLQNPSAIPILYNVGVTPTLPDDMASQLANAISGSGLGITATWDVGAARVVLRGERLAMLSPDTVSVELEGKTIFVDKTSGTNLVGTLQKPFDNISAAFATTAPGDIVRLVGNGGSDGLVETLDDNLAYEIGFGLSGGPSVLADGSTMAVPKGVTAMIDAGAVLKLRRARIGVGSSSAGVDRSAASLQVLGTPQLPVYFTSWLDESIGRDGYQPVTTPGPGDWGGIVFRADQDNAEGRFNYEDEGIFLNYVNFADMRYGGGLVRVDTVDQVINPVQMIDMRPTITFNTITFSADAALSAAPNSFEETNFHSPEYQLVEEFTSDYERIGPEIHGNRLVDNSINGLFIRIVTPAGTELRSLTVPGRFDDVDIVHVISENLKIQGQPGEALLEQSRPTVNLVTAGPLVGGRLPAAVYNYKVVFVDENGFEGRPSEATANVTVTAGTGSVQLNGLPPVSGNFVARRLYRSQPGGAGPYNLIADLDANDGDYIDRGAVASSLTDKLLKREPASVIGVTLEAASSTPAPTPPLPTGVLAGGSYNYRVSFLGADGAESPVSDATATITVTGGPADGSIRLDSLPDPAALGYVGTRIYRSTVGGGGPYYLVADLPSGGTSFDDAGTFQTDASG
ncbi:MAG: hypothetical protein JJ992_25150, partial [Planctomycetes bacterium]|nr:hypothetical protein [Planctomycetota bacterium]